MAGIPLNNGLAINAPYPPDNKMVVGTGYTYADKSEIDSDYLYNGMQVHDADEHITYELTLTEAGVVTWTNISCGATILALNASGISVKSGDNAYIAVDTDITFKALTYGTIESIEWTFEDGTVLTSNDQSVTLQWNAVGDYDIVLSITDTFGNTITNSITIQVLNSNIVPITSFEVTPDIGFNDVTHDFEFEAVFGRDVYLADISTLSIVYGATTVPLISGGKFINGVTLASNVLTVESNLFSLSGLNDIGFTLNITLTNGDTGSKSVTYYAASKISASLTLSSVITNRAEYITALSTLSEYDATLYSVTGVLTSTVPGVTSTNITFTGESKTNYFTVSPLLTAGTFTLVITQILLGNTRDEYSASITGTLNPYWSQFSISSFSINPTEILINGDDITITATVNKSLANADKIELIEGSGLVTTEYEFEGLTGTTINETITLDKSTVGTYSYRLRITETSPIDDSKKITLSSAISITTLEVLGDPIYWGTFVNTPGMIEEDLLDYIRSLYAELASSDICVSSGETPPLTFRFFANFAEGTMDKYSWVAVPVSKFDYFNKIAIIGIGGYYDTTSDFYYSSSETINGESYKLYFSKNIGVPSNYYFNIITE